MVTIDSEFDIEKCICVGCKHNFSFAKLNCKAFPEGIPEDVLKGENRHSEVLKNQKGKLIYERRKD